jgi:hypothetical protein
MSLEDSRLSLEAALKETIMASASGTLPDMSKPGTALEHSRVMFENMIEALTTAQMVMGGVTSLAVLVMKATAEDLRVVAAQDFQGTSFKVYVRDEFVAELTSKRDEPQVGKQNAWEWSIGLRLSDKVFATIDLTSEALSS